MKKIVLLFLISPIIGSCFYSNDANKEEAQKIEKSPQTRQTVEAENFEKEKIELNANLALANPSFRIFGNEINLELCKEITPMTKSLFELKYPFENFHSSYAYSNNDGTITLLVCPRQETLCVDLSNYQKAVTSNFSANPYIELKRSEIKKINGRDFIVVEMVTPAVDTQIYNLMYMTSVDGKLLVCTFNCTLELLSEWQPRGERMLNSIKLNDIKNLTFK